MGLILVWHFFSHFQAGTHHFPFTKQKKGWWDGSVFGKGVWPPKCEPGAHMVDEVCLPASSDVYSYVMDMHMNVCTDDDNHRHNKKKKETNPAGVLSHTCNPSASEGDAEGSH